MLNTLRQRSGGLVAKIFIGVLALSFAVWGISDIFTGYRGDALALVGEQKITPDEFQFTMQREMRALSNQLGQSLTMDQARQLGLDRRVLGELIQQAALDERARQMGLAIADKAIAQRIMSNPIFQNARGEFDRAGFQQMLASNGLTEQSYVAMQRETMLRSHLAGAIENNVSVPETLVEAAFIHQNQRRKASYFEIDPDKLGTVPAPNEEDLKAYYEENKRAFTAPEFRTLRLLRLQPEDVASNVTVTDEELQQAFEHQRDDFSTPERREVQQIVFANVEEAKAARDRMAGGVDFEEIAREKGLQPVDYNLGTVSRRDIPDQAIAEAAFTLEQGEVSQPVEGRLATVLLRVTAIHPGEERELAEVEDELRRSVALGKARDEVLKIHDLIEDERAGGATLDEIAQKLDLPLIHVDAVDRRGNGPDGAPLENLPAAERVLATAFASDVAVENDPVETAEEGFVWVEVMEVTPEANRPFQEVRQEVAERWSAERAREIAHAKAEELTEQARAEASLQSAAASIGAEIAETPMLKRGDTHAAFGREAIDSLFRHREGDIAYVASANGGGYIVFNVTGIDSPEFNPDSAEPNALRQQLNAAGVQDFLQQYLVALQEEIGITINEQLWRRLQGRPE